MKRLVVNDALSQLGERTFWHMLIEWLDAEFVGGDYATLAEKAKVAAKDASLIVRNATWFPPIEAACPQISLLQDISPDGEMRKMQEAVCQSSRAIVFNSEFTRNAHTPTLQFRAAERGKFPWPYVIPLPVDFSLFVPQNAFACQQALGLPDGCVLWIGASQGAAGHVKGFDTFCQVVRLNPDISFVAVFKDAPPESIPPNMRAYARLTQVDLVKVIGACRVGLCTSRTESQHLAGIEMGACGLPLVVPPVGAYWGKTNVPGLLLPENPSINDYQQSIRCILAQHNADVPAIRGYWAKEFDIPVVKAAWLALVEEVENEMV